MRSILALLPAVIAVLGMLLVTVIVITTVP